MQYNVHIAEKVQQFQNLEYISIPVFRNAHVYRNYSENYNCKVIWTASLYPAH